MSKTIDSEEELEKRVASDIAKRDLESLKESFSSFDGYGMNSLQMLVDSGWPEGRGWLMEEGKERWQQFLNPTHIDFDFTKVAENNDPELAEFLMKELGLLPSEESFEKTLRIAGQMKHHDMFALLIYDVTSLHEEFDHWSAIQDVDTIYGIEPLSFLKAAVEWKDAKILWWVIDSLNNRLLYKLELESGVSDNPIQAIDDEDESDEDDDFEDEDDDTDELTGEEVLMKLLSQKNEWEFSVQLSKIVKVDIFEEKSDLIPKDYRKQISDNQKRFLG
jgi:hypothetical protein